MLKDDRYLFDSILWPMLMARGGDLTASSTPKKTFSVFHDMWCDPKFSKHHYDYEVGLQVGQLSHEIVNMLREKYKNNPFMWATEMLARFYEEYDRFLPFDLLKDCVAVGSAGLRLEPPTESGRYFIGVDFGKHKDHSVIVIVKQVDSKLELVYCKVYDLNTPYMQVVKDLVKLDRELRYVSRMLVDSSGVGEYIYEDLRKQVSRAEGVKFTLPRKTALANLLKSSLEQQIIILPDDQDLLTQLNIVTYKTLESGQLKFECPEEQHDDVFWATCLAVAAAREPSGTEVTQL